jgi:hypothetical protein
MRDMRERLERLEKRLDSLDSDVRDLLGGDRQSVVDVVELLAQRRSLRAPRQTEPAASWAWRQWLTYALPIAAAAALGATLGVMRACGVPVAPVPPAGVTDGTGGY